MLKNTWHKIYTIIREEDKEEVIMLAVVKGKANADLVAESLSSIYKNIVVDF